MIGAEVPAPGGPHAQDDALFPPPALPHKPGRVREYNLTAVDRTIEIAPGVFFEAWTYNGTVPGPIIRATEDDILRVNLKNAGSHPHTIHFHGIHPADMDGVFETVNPGDSFTYEFRARPYGMQLYHCHATPLKKHIHKGLYGAFIIDPKKPRPPARELVMVMNGYDTDARRREQLLHRQRALVLLREVPDQGQEERARPDLPREPDRVRSHQLATPPRRLLPLLPDRLDRPLRVHGHGDALPGRARDHRDRVRQHGALHVPRAPERVRGARLDGLLRRERPDVESGSLASKLSGAHWRLWALLPIVALVGWSRSSSPPAARCSSSSGRTRRPRTSSTSAGSSSGRARSRSRYEPPARRHHDRFRHRRRRDRALLARRRADAGAASLPTVVVPYDWVDGEPGSASA